ncbi:MAG: two-component sensor histidine kinase [Alphaproteobacteria bacterium]|jgi:two-component system sensor histidine kinase RegB|nr:two-component sensor histidine kinase [Alphaproteobacteria bacterium]
MAGTAEKSIDSASPAASLEAAERERSFTVQAGVRLRALVIIRWAAVAGQLLTVATVQWGLGYGLPVLPVLAVIATSALLNIVVSVGRPATARLIDRDAAIFLGFDIIQLTALLYLTGGLHNPFAILLLAPVAVAATVLSFRSTLALSLLTIGCISFIGLLRKPLPWPGQEPHLPGLYVGALWIGLVLTALLVALYAWRVAEEARRMANALAATSEALARERRMSALGALAASAAHELGSPLGTITLIADDLQHSVGPDSPLHEDVRLLGQEARRCRDILTSLAQKPTEDVSAMYLQVPLPALVESAGEPYRRPDVALRFTAGPATPEAPVTAPLVTRSAELIQGLGNLLQNALQFARREVRVTTAWTRHEVLVEISDDGPGFAADILESLGEPYMSTRTGEGGHMGLGVFIAKNLLARGGGAVSFANAPTGGARVVVRWQNPTFKETDRKGART